MYTAVLTSLKNKPYLHICPRRLILIRGLLQVAVHLEQAPLKVHQAGRDMSRDRNRSTRPIGNASAKPAASSRYRSMLELLYLHSVWRQSRPGLSGSPNNVVRFLPGRCGVRQHHIWLLYDFPSFAKLITHSREKPWQR